MMYTLLYTAMEHLMSMVRKQIYLEDAQNRDVKAEAASRGIAEAEVIRERISRHPERRFIRDPRLREELLRSLSLVIKEADPSQPDRDISFNREDLYDDDEPLSATDPVRHNDAGVRGHAKRRA